MFLIATLAHAQDSQFSFDANGNLLTESAAALAPPQILSQPQPQVAAPGESASFSVVVTDTRGLAYQWRFNDVDIIGATGEALLLQGVGTSHEGQYTVVLVNASGSVTSAPALLMIDADTDGLADSWELANFGSLAQYPTGDFDRDGASNLTEFRDGTDPADGASRRFRLTVMSDGGTVSIEPPRLVYTNGEVATLTAATIGEQMFQGWTGHVVSTNNSVTVTMTNDVSVFARYGTYEIVWTNSASGNWHVPVNWSPNIVPNHDDIVRIISSPTITLNGEGHCGDLSFGEPTGIPTLTGSGSLSIHRNAFWGAGTMSGGGRTVIQPGATLTIDNTAATSGVVLNTRALENGGMVFWNAGGITLSSAVVTNRPGALFHAATANTIQNSLGASRFDNAGTFRKTTSGTTALLSGASFNNSGEVQIENGTLSLGGGGRHSGNFEVATSATLNFSGGTHVANTASTISGPGNLRCSGGTATLAGPVHLQGTHTFSSGTANLTGDYICTNNTVAISGGIANFSGTGLVAPAVITLSNGALGGGSSVTALTQMTWSGGQMNGSGRTIIASGATFTINNPLNVNLITRTVENAGTISWTGSQMTLNNAVITNRPGALFHAQNAQLTTGGGASRFDNAGTFRKSANSGVSTVGGSISFNNYDTAQIQTGTLAIDGGGLNVGTIDVAAGATLDFGGGTFTSSAASTISGAGRLTVSGATATLAGLVNLQGTHIFSSGTANLTGNYICTSNTLTISGGTANFNGTGVVSPAIMTLSNGSLGGSNSVTALTQMIWSGGAMGGGGRTLIASGATLTINSPVNLNLNSRTLDNAGTVLWTGGGGLTTFGAVITNRPGSLFHAQNAAPLAPGGGVNRFDNAGTFRKSGNSGTTGFNSVSFNNYGAVELQTGTLSIDGGGLNHSTIDVAAGATLRFSGGTFTSSAVSTIAGAGRFTVNNGTITLAGVVDLAGAHTFNGGTANLTGGHICTNMLIVSGGTANLSGIGIVTPRVVTLSGGTLTGSSIVTVLSQMTWSGGFMSGSGRTLIASGATLTVNSPPPFNVNLNTRTLDNAGTVLWTGAGFNLSSTVITNRPGALFQAQNAQSMSASAGVNRFDNAGTFRKTAAGTTTFSSNVRFNNYGIVDIQKGIVAANAGYVSSANALLSCGIGGVTAGTDYGRLQVQGTVTLNGALSVFLTNAFVPASNATFTVLTAGTRNGTFASFFYPSNEVTMQSSNTPNSVIVRVTDVAPAKPMLLQPEISGSDVRLTWTALSNTRYRLEFIFDLNSTNWAALSGDVTGVSNTASKLDALTPSNRFYRIRVIP